MPMRFHKCIHEYGFVPVDEVDRSVCEQISAINSTDVLRGRVAQRSVYCQFMKPVAGRRVFLIDVYRPESNQAVSRLAESVPSFRLWLTNTIYGPYALQEPA
jgi:hypothetical protein